MDTRLLRPQGFLGYTFLGVRVLAIVSSGLIVGFTITFTLTFKNADLGLPPTIVALLALTGTALLYTFVTVTSYSRRFLPYLATLILDLALLIPIVAVTILLAQPVTIRSCGTLAPSTNYTITILPKSSFGRTSFPPGSNAQETCYRVFAIWIALIALSLLFILSTVTLILLQLRERKLKIQEYNFNENPLDPVNRPGAGFFTQRPITVISNPSRDYSAGKPPSKKQWDSFGDWDRDFDEKKSQWRPSSDRIDSWNTSSTASSSNSPYKTENVIPRSSTVISNIREYRPRPRGVDSPTLPNRPSDLAKAYRNYRNSTATTSAAPSSPSTRPRSRQRGQPGNPR
ncbi:hypothetical protein QBC40DRAFT_174476 [Triangularia verruculosa]|uniref:MARVEL domain-containing protein n=1 Tax=Triangularia verruculosa TaxID=2587418 RepID=A0AAN6XKM9_9PEZI|nr:hypothetical protein QBC40DRAFT_174476 [Triangularia verruculosa]